MLKRSRDEWYSSPFYSHPGGYKLCLKVDAYGRSSGTGTHLSVLIKLMKGEHDSYLEWPFRGSITLQLVNYNSDQCHHEMTVLFDDSAVADGRVAKRVTVGERARYGCGYGQFLSHSEVEASTGTRQFLKNGCVVFRVTNIMVFQ